MHWKGVLMCLCQYLPAGQSGEEKYKFVTHDLTWMTNSNFAKGTTKKVKKEDVLLGAL